MVRVLHIVTYMGRGGLETMLMNYYRNMDRTKVQFDFVVHRDFKADYDDEIEELGGIIYRLPRLNPFSIKYKKALGDLLESHPEYRIVHVHQDCLSSVALKIAKEKGVPVRIGHSHNANQDRNIKYLIKLWYMRSIPRYATDLFACGKDAGEWMFRGHEYSILNNAINTDEFVFSPEVRKNKRDELKLTDEFLVGHVGRFSPQKNHTFLIDVFNEIVKLDNNSKLLLVGSGSLADVIKEKVETLGLQEKVLFLGNRDDVNQLMQAMDVFVFPSLYEGIGIVNIEAQAAGLKCFASNTVPKVAQMIDENFTFISLDKSPKDWASIIITTKNAKRENCKKQIMKANYDIKTNAKWLQDFYLEKVD